MAWGDMVNNPRPRGGGNGKRKDLDSNSQVCSGQVCSGQLSECVEVFANVGHLGLLVL